MVCYKIASLKIKYIFKIITKEQYHNLLINNKFSKVFSPKTRKTHITFFLQKDNTIKIKITQHSNIITQNQ